MMEFNNDNPIYQESPISNINELLSKVFFRMFLGLLATAIVACYTYYSGFLDDFAQRGGFVFCIIAELVVVLVFSLGFRKLSAGVVTALFYAYSILTGLTFSTIFIAFELQTIAYAFIGSAALFGIMAYLGKNNKADLTKLGTFLTISLVIALIVTLVNLFIGSTLIDIALDWVILAIFMGYTFFDINKIINLQNSGYIDDEHLYVYGAMELYLDFINLFIRILSILSRRKD